MAALWAALVEQPLLLLQQYRRAMQVSDVQLGVPPQKLPDPLLLEPEQTVL